MRILYLESDTHKLAQNVGFACQSGHKLMRMMDNEEILRQLSSKANIEFDES